MKKIVVNTWRGVGYLPYCGNHPGTPILFLCTVIGMCASMSEDLNISVLEGGIWGFLLILPFYLFGAYSRSIFNDALVKKSKIN